MKPPLQVVDRGERDRVDEDVEPAPPAVDLGEERVDLFLLRDVARPDRDRLVVRQRRDELEHVVLQPFVGPVERELGAFALERRGNPPGDAALVADAHDERFLSVKETHRRESSQM